MKKSVRVLFLGSRDLAFNILNWLLSEQKLFFIAGVCSETITDETKYWENDPVDLCRDKNIDIIPLENIESLEFDTALSVNYTKIIPEKYLGLAELGFWNVHHSYNLRVRGRHTITHSILNADEDNIFYHGTCLHKITPQLDAGPIVASTATPILDNDTAFSLFTRLNSLAFELVREWFPRICYQKVYPYYPPDNQQNRMYKKSDIPSRQIDCNCPVSYIRKHVRAFDFTGYPPAQLITENGLVDLVYAPRDGYIIPFEINGEIFYTNSVSNGSQE